MTFCALGSFVWGWWEREGRWTEQKMETTTVGNKNHGTSPPTKNWLATRLPVYKVKTGFLKGKEPSQIPCVKKTSPVQKKCQGLHLRTGSRHCWRIRLEQKIGQDISQKNDGNVPSRKKWGLKKYAQFKRKGVGTCILDIIFRFDSIFCDVFLFKNLPAVPECLILKLFEWVAMALKENMIFCLGAFCKRVDLIP